jgi:hypothetical protein
MAHACKYAGCLACTVGPNCTVWLRTFAHTVLYGKSYDTAYTVPYIQCHFGIRHSATALHICMLYIISRRKEKNYAGMITPQAWIKETETLLSDSEVLTLPGGFEPATPKSLA